MADPARRRATYEDVLASPSHVIAEVFDGELYTQPRPGKPHAAATSALGEELGPPFKRGRGGPGGWILIDEPELHLGDDIFVPDLAGFRRARMPFMTNESAYFDVAPDWVCEVLSESTQTRDRGLKVPKYAQAGVPHAWLVDPLARTLEVLRLVGKNYINVGFFEGHTRVRAEPFEAIELDLAVLWADVVL